MKYPITIGLTIASHIPQIVKSIKAGKKVRVIADQNKFFNKKVIGLHLLALSTFIYEYSAQNKNSQKTNMRS